MKATICVMEMVVKTMSQWYLVCPGLDSTWPPLPPDSCDVSRGRAQAAVGDISDIHDSGQNMSLQNCDSRHRHRQSTDNLMILGSSILHSSSIVSIYDNSNYSCE